MAILSDILRRRHRPEDGAIPGKSGNQLLSSLQTALTFGESPTVRWDQSESGGIRAHVKTKSNNEDTCRFQVVFTDGRIYVRPGTLTMGSMEHGEFKSDFPELAEVRSTGKINETPAPYEDIQNLDSATEYLLILKVGEDGIQLLIVKENDIMATMPPEGGLVIEIAKWKFGSSYEIEEFEQNICSDIVLCCEVEESSSSSCLSSDSSCPSEEGSQPPPDGGSSSSSGTSDNPGGGSGSSGSQGSEGGGGSDGSGGSGAHPDCKILCTPNGAEIEISEVSEGNWKGSAPAAGGGELDVCLIHDNGVWDIFTKPVGGSDLTKRAFRSGTSDNPCGPYVKVGNGPSGDKKWEVKEKGSGSSGGDGSGGSSGSENSGGGGSETSGGSGDESGGGPPECVILKCTPIEGGEPVKIRLCQDVLFGCDYGGRLSGKKYCLDYKAGSWNLEISDDPSGANEESISDPTANDENNPSGDFRIGDNDYTICPDVTSGSDGSETSNTSGGGSGPGGGSESGGGGSGNPPGGGSGGSGDSGSESCQPPDCITMQCTDGGGNSAFFDMDFVGGQYSGTAGGEDFYLYFVGGCWNLEKGDPPQNSKSPIATDPCSPFGGTFNIDGLIYQPTVKQSDSGSGGSESDSASGSDAGGSGGQGSEGSGTSGGSEGGGGDGSDGSEGSQGSDTGSDDSGGGGSQGSGGSQDSGGSGGPGSEKTAIVKAPWTKTGYAAIYCMEMPEVRVEDVMRVKLDGRRKRVSVCPRFAHIYEPGTLEVCGYAPSSPVPMGFAVDDDDVLIQQRYLFKGADSVRLRVTAIRKGFLKIRLEPRTKAQYEQNEKHIKSAYPRKKVAGRALGGGGTMKWS